ncbi:MAG: pyocin activator PrtN family protein [Pseudomonadales bacterium]|tara:strand:+ start:10074 stop:10322 length:249 start_codon:yes stop_codon:yes gene_type:complete
MSNATLAQLRRRYTLPYLTLAELRAECFPHIQTDRHLLRLIDEGAVSITLTQLHKSQRAPQIVTLQELARYLDAQLEQSQAA